MNACHTFGHKNIFNQNINRNSNEKSLNKKIINSEYTVKKSSENSEMATIDLPKQTEIIQKVIIQKQVKLPNVNTFSLDKFLNWNEAKVIKTLGSSNFIKMEGKLKNYQYHFKECFIDIFLLKKNQLYLVDYVEIRPTKLNGKINTKACFEEINRTFN